VFSQVLKGCQLTSYSVSQLNEVQIIIVPNLFCGLLGVQNLFCGLLFVPNLFCGLTGMPVILRFYFLDITVRHEIGKRYINFQILCNTHIYKVFCITILIKKQRLILCGTLWHSVFSVLKNFFEIDFSLHSILLNY